MGDNVVSLPTTGRHRVPTVVVPKRPWRELNHADIGGHRPDRSALVVRYGGFGDMIMASTILPQLKADGWHVTVNTNPRGADVIGTDPHVDEILLQDTGQVPNHELLEFWAWLRGAFGRYIQLSESVEGNLLVSGPKPTRNDDGTVSWQPPDEAFDWPHEKRHALLNRNYIEETHRIAGVPFEGQRTGFYPTVAERSWARDLIAKWKRRKKLNRLVMVVWSGSSTHKSYPWMDNVIARTMTDAPDTGFVTSGDDICRMLDDNWVNEARVIRRTGRDTIRQTLVLAQHCDVVVGPETGVLNAVSMNPSVKKVVMLSHSSVENLCKHWINTQALYSAVECYPCHQLHYTMESCSRCPVTHGARCQSEIPFEIVVEAILGTAETRRVVGH